MPQLWIVAGPNGAGKTTLADEYLVPRLSFVSPDTIAREDGVPPIEAGRRALGRQGALLAAGRDFAVETTLSGRHELELMRKAAAAGYKVSLVFVGVSTPAVSRSRIAVRVARGGHAVPARDVARRFERSLAQLPTAIALAHRAFVIDNTGRQYRLLLSIEGGRRRYASPRPPAWLVQAFIAEQPSSRLVLE